MGSANFTAGGLTHNRELVTWREDRPVVEALRHWFAQYWDHPSASDYKDELIAALDRTPFGQTAFTPYHVLIRTLAARYGEERPPSLEAATFQLKWFQEDAVFRLIQMLTPAHGARGALLADAVGLGKTYMALGVIHHYLYSMTRGAGAGPPVVILLPASMEAMWDELLRRYQLRWACSLVTLQSLTRTADVQPHQGAGLVVIDEAHRLRSRGVWFDQVMTLLTGGPADKRVLLLTATPVNTGIRDLTTLLQVLTRNRREAFAPAIADFEAYLRRVEKQEVDAFPLLDRTIVRRSRSDIEAQYRERLRAGMHAVERPKLPQRVLEHVRYAYQTDGADDLFERFATTLRTLRLAPYDLRPYRGAALPKLPLGDEDGPTFPPGSMAALVAAGLLKRFESSLTAIERSLRRLVILLVRFDEGLRATPPRILSLADNPEARMLLQRERDEDADEDSGIDFDARWRALLAEVPALPPDQDLDLGRVRSAVAADLTAVRDLQTRLPAAATDGKLTALRQLFAPGGPLQGRRTLCFTQFRDTAEAAHAALADPGWRQHAGVGPVALIHGATPADERAQVAATFDPNATGSGPLYSGDTPAPQILVSTDVLAEGHNLQLAEAVVNIDLHWNPQVVVQRAGRVDRLDSPHPRVRIVSFVPEEGLEAHLGLLQALEARFHLIHVLGLGDEPVTRLRTDRPTVTFDQMRRLYRDDVSVLDEIERAWTLGSTDFMRAPLEAYLQRHARESLESIPVGVQSVKGMPGERGTLGPGVFVAFAFEGESVWRFYPQTPDGWGPVVVDEGAIFRAIRCTEGEPRRPLPEPFPGPGGVIDWSLLHRAAVEVADELTARRATAALQRGASERSRRLRQRVVDGLAGSELQSEAADLLDRLEEVRVEDYDHRPGWDTFHRALRAAERATTPAERHDALAEMVARGQQLFGAPERPDAQPPTSVAPDDLQLVAWEILTEPPAGVLVARAYQPSLPGTPDGEHSR